MADIVRLDSTDDLRTPPHSIEAEQSVLGGLMLDNEAWEKVADVLLEDDFYRNDHRLIFSAIKHLAEHDKPYDVITLSEWLKERDELENAGGLAYLGRIVKDTPTAANIQAYAEIVRDRSVLRSLIRVGTDIADDAYRPEGRAPSELLENAEQSVFEIAEQGARGKKDFQSIQQLLSTAVDKVQELFERGEPVTGLSTGFADLDKLTSGLQAGDLIIVAGRPSMGKTTFSMNIAENVAVGEKRPVAIFSLEMPGDQLALRMMSSLGRIDQHSVRSGQLSDQDWVKLNSAVMLLSDSTMHIDDTPSISPGELRAKARRLKREKGDLGLIVVDYLQLMKLEGAESRVAEISEISRSLKATAKELNVPVIALSQLNRSLEQRPNKRPVMSDLRESGAIEQDADLIAFIYRDEVYNPDSPDKGTAEIIVGKHRNGPIGVTRMTFLGKYTRFEDWAPDAVRAEDYEL